MNLGYMELMFTHEAVKENTASQGAIASALILLLLGEF